MRRITIGLGMWLLVALPAAADARTASAGHLHSPSSRSDVAQRSELDALRRAYLASVQDAGAIGRGLREVARLRAAGAASPERASLLTAYEGALVTLRAKHAFWPAQKMRYMREGLALLDRSVAAYPDGAEARYLRLMTCYYLPGFFGRNWSVREDFAAVAKLLPTVRAHYPADLYAAIARFVVEKGELAPAERRALEATLGA